MYYGLFYDYYYVALVLPALIASIIIQIKLKTTYSKYSGIGNFRGITGAQAAQMVLNYYGITDVQIVPGRGTLTDYFDPRKKIICLSEGVYNKSSIAAVGIACHEAGHAAQHAEQYKPIVVRNTFVPVCNIGSRLSIPLLIIGIVVGFEPLVWVGIILFSLVALFQFLTLPVEFNASNRAIKVIEANGLLTVEERMGAVKVLKAAALTYVASLAVTLAQLLRLVLKFSGRRD